MQSFQDLIARYKPGSGAFAPGSETVHATLAAFPGRLAQLESAVKSLLGQVDTLHIFLDDFDDIPAFLDHPKIYLTRSQDLGNLGECGKYYWTDDLQGYHFICSDRIIYPQDYVNSMKARIEEHDRKAVIGCGGYHITEPFRSCSRSMPAIRESDLHEKDATVPVITDLATAYHSSTIHVSRHFFYQPELSDLWFSIIALEQQIPLICCRHHKDWLKPSALEMKERSKNRETGYLRTFLIRSYFTQPAEMKDNHDAFTINNYFDKIFVINLKRRRDRWKKAKRTARKYNIRVKRFKAVDGYKKTPKSTWEKYFSSELVKLPEGIEPLVDYRDKFLKYHHYLSRIHFIETKLGRKAIQSPGAWGVELSYIGILKQAIRKNYKRILILEDDIILHHSFNKEFEARAKALPDDWKLIMLGAMQHRWEPYIKWYNEGLYHCHGSSTASHAVGFDRKAYLQLLYYAMKMDLPIDEGAEFHVKNVYDRQCFIFYPNLAIQEMTESDIGSSVMKPEEIDAWTVKFRWNLKDYDFI